MNLDATATHLAGILVEKKLRVVFAESCTGGLVAATLAGVPGISEYLCGSAVTYRNRTKQDWLGVSASDIDRFTAVSEPVARQMATGVLKQTPEADFATAVTGHLGPDAPADCDGVIYVGIAVRTSIVDEVCDVRRYELVSESRIERQREAAGLVFRLLGEQIQSQSPLRD